MVGPCSTGQSLQWTVVPMEEKEEESTEEQSKKVREELESVREDNNVQPKCR